MRIPKYKKKFVKSYTENWSEEFFVMKEIKNTVPWTYVISDLNDEEIVGTFYETVLLKTSQKEFRIEKIIEKKGNRLHFIWKACDNSFNSWINKKNRV